ncbi:Cullin repeat-like-containing domain protein [Phycomyces nitens]|nr:Cullin repeat-like-containing domain protein [Phycomyces nitens]
MNTSSSSYTSGFQSGISVKPSSRAPPSHNGAFPSATPIVIDLHRFADENMQPEEYVHRALGDANEEGIRAFHKSLVESKHVVGGDLQRNVYRNYTEFVAISKEISNLDGDVLHLKGYLNELRNIWEGFLASTDTSNELLPANTGAFSEPILPQRKRSELMATDMQTIHRAQIVALWENVEGSQKFIPYAQDRQIVRECVNFVEIDPRTGQPRQAVHIFILNNCILVASRKKRSMANKYKLVAEYFWVLENTTVLDIKDSPDRPEDKLGLLHAYRRVMDEDDDKNQDRANDNGRPNNGRDNQQNTSLDSEDLKWLTELPDELEVLIAIREFENAVGSIEKARTIFKGCPADLAELRDIRSQVQKYTDLLCATISHDLGNILLTKLQFQRFVGWLLRLDKGEQAREVFLATRSLIIKKRIRQLIFEGDIPTYIGELALVVFTLIRNTCEWYRDSFKQNDMASGFVNWVREQTNIYATIYKRQVFNNSHLSCQIISDCFKSTLDQCAILRKVGLDLKFLLEDLFLENVKETVVNYEKRNVEKADRFAKNDNFSIVASQNLGNYIPIRLNDRPEMKVLNKKPIMCCRHGRQGDRQCSELLQPLDQICERYLPACKTPGKKEKKRQKLVVFKTSLRRVNGHCMLSSYILL